MKSMDETMSMIFKVIGTERMKKMSPIEKIGVECCEMLLKLPRKEKPYTPTAFEAYSDSETYCGQNTYCYTLDTFEVELYPDWEWSQIAFWKKGRRQEEQMLLTNCLESLYVQYPRNRFITSTYSDRNRIEIEENYYLTEDLRFPNMYVVWICDKTGTIPKGILYSFRLELDPSIVHYEYQNGAYKMIVRKGALDLALLGLSEDFSNVSEVLGKAIEMKIDFDAREKEIMKRSHLMELYEEIRRSYASKSEDKAK